MQRLGQRLVSGLHARTPRGRLYEVDARLRPSGSKGLLVSSFDGWARYHAEEARLWERQALIKLRPVAGDDALGAKVAQHAREHVWGAPPGDAAAIAAEVAAMRDRMERELGSPGDLKVGRGGIIDVEFAAQCVQLVHGHAHPALRTPSTETALRAAAEAGVADAGALDVLADGYRFLRRIEHRLRVVHDQPVQRLPEDATELEQLARRAGFPSGEVLRERTERWRRDIRAAYDAIVTRRG
jgi:glutamate-ammonia-ligase adenylyltransferase